MLLPKGAFPPVSDLPGTFSSIGTRQEKILHREIKRYLCPDEACHEFPIGRFVADIFRDGRILEIQTGSFRPLRHKLETLVPDYSITVVHPVIRKKTIRTVDELGILSPAKRSPKQGNPLSVCRELSLIRPLLDHQNLDILVVFCDVEEYRSRAIVRRGRKTYERIDQYPKGEPLLLPLKTPEDYRNLLPKEMPETFTAKEFAKCVRLGKSDAEGVLLTFRTLGIFIVEGKVGRAYRYRLLPENK